MTKTFTASTIELENSEIAIKEIKSQLNFDSNLLHNTIGILSCHQEFVLNGIAQAIIAALPFKVVGTVASVQSIGAEAPEPFLLTLMVITSDDVEYKTILTPSILENPKQVIADSYKKCAADKAPALIIMLSSFIMQNSAAEYVNVLTDISGGVPCFGTIAVDDTFNFEHSYLISDSEFYNDRMCLVLAYGNLSPKFYVANISPSKAIGSKAIVTKSEGHLIKEIDGQSVETFMRGMGINIDITTGYDMAQLPFLIDYNDGSLPVSRLLIAMTPEGYAICASDVPEGRGIQFAQSDAEDVIYTLDQTAEELKADISNANGLLAYTCIARCVTLGSNQYGEMKKLSEKIANKIPFMMTSSGGEICPIDSIGGKTINRAHNNAFIACLF
ncbi:MAG: FIST C-terminal domain-containing protein [Defluviitaleaceae bacterium]|nr:FIST C-terminal domain-containing protein [Defluviitaleaceae bacterium]